MADGNGNGRRDLSGCLVFFIIVIAFGFILIYASQMGGK